MTLVELCSSEQSHPADGTRFELSEPVEIIMTQYTPGLTLTLLDIDESLRSDLWIRTDRVHDGAVVFELEVTMT